MAYAGADAKHARYCYGRHGGWVHVGTPAGRDAAECLMVSGCCQAADAKKRMLRDDDGTQNKRG